MSNWLVAVLFGVGLLAVAMGGQAAEQAIPPASAKLDDKGKDSKPAFRAGAVRYEVKDVDRSLAFYTKHLGFKVEQQFAGAPFASVSNGSLILWLSGRRVQAPAPWPTAASRSLAGGTGSSCRSMTWRQLSPN